MNCCGNWPRHFVSFSLNIKEGWRWLFLAVHGAGGEARAARKAVLLLGRMALLRVNMDMMTRKDTANTGNRGIIGYNLLEEQAIKSSGSV